MQNSKVINPSYIRSLNYTDFISFIRETNRCPGGKNSIREIVQNTFVGPNSRILDVGSNTGFNSLELAHITSSKVYGIDISESCVNEAKNRLTIDSKDIQKRVTFSVGSAYDLPFRPNFFDLVMCGGATSFMDNKSKAVKEYFRVLKPWGFLATTQLFYSKKPPQNILDSVSNIIGVQIKYLNKDDWLNVFKSNNSHEIYYFREYKFETRSEIDVEKYVSIFMQKPHIASLDKKVKEEISKKWMFYMASFAKNNDYLSYFVALFRKDNLYPEEKEFFTLNRYE
ncbi:MAG: class I SAM-dependent methyltransferase [Candidatus Shapirobacteria bacterium]|jgi:ubiquinone/menaquinone biosynthesis C-methylase UbiE